MQRSRIARTAVSLTALSLVAAGGAWALGRDGGGAPGGAAGGGTASPRLDLAAYRSFSGCDDLLAHLRTQALPLVTPYGLDTGDGGDVIALAERSGVAGAADGSRAAGVPVPQAAPGATSGTGTNIQVAGVDEADVTKKVGDLVLTVASGRRPGLSVLRGDSRDLRPVGRLDTDWRPDQLLVQGDRVLLLGGAGDGAALPVPEPGGAAPEILPGPVGMRTRVAEVDVSDPAKPELLRTLDLDGRLVGARLAGGVVRLAVSGTPSRLRFAQPGVPGSDPTRGGTGQDPAAEALAANQRVVRTSPVDDWLPRYTLTPAGGTASAGQLVSCDHVGVPGQFSGLGTLAMLTFDLRSGGIDRWQSGGVVAGGATLYSTGDRTYVTTRPWSRPPSIRGPLQREAPPLGDRTSKPVPERTAVHAFDTTADGVRYLGSGSVQGTLIGQYAMDEYEGRLRVATTIRPQPRLLRPDVAPGAADGSTGSGDPDDAVTSDDATSSRLRRPWTRTPTSSSVTVLQLRDGRLEQVGRVDGLGVDEVIHGVRFAGPRAYVVTFRQTDPLYVLDLSDPAKPRVTGELKVLGYSAYLHPLGDGLLLGVGQDATETGQRTGLLLSLFDVSDPASPRLVDRVTVPGAWPSAESDAHAFTYADGLALIPLEGSRLDAMRQGATPGGTVDAPPGAGLLAVRVDKGRLGTPGVLRVARGNGDAAVDAVSMRAFVGGGLVWTVAPAQPQPIAVVHEVATGRRLSVTPF